MLQLDRSLWSALNAHPDLSTRFLTGPAATISFADVVAGSCLVDSAASLQGRSVLVATQDQFAAALALIELDGVARRIVLCPPDLPVELLPYIVDSVPVDTIVSNRSDLGAVTSTVQQFVPCTPAITPRRWDRNPCCETEWILLTSGTTGRPKMVVHTLSALAGAIHAGGPQPAGLVWSTFYDIRRYGGLQVFLRAVLSGGSLVLSDAKESTVDFLSRAGSSKVSHISGTPSHWRKAIMSPAVHEIAPQYVRLSGEIADQSILDNLRACYPEAGIAHAFASTEAGVAFDVRDGFAGFPASLLTLGAGEVSMKVVDDSLRIRSPRTASCYIGGHSGTLLDADGYVDTGDMVELRGDRYYFVGRRDGVINVGGLKVHPEEVESVINRHPSVRISLVKTRKNPITGALVVADVVLKTPAENGHAGTLEQEILQLCRVSLPRHKVPAAISFLKDLPVAGTGKLVRRHA